MKYEAQILLGNAGHIQFRFEFLLIENKNQCCVKEFSSGLVNIVQKSYDFLPASWRSFVRNRLVSWYTWPHFLSIWGQCCLMKGAQAARVLEQAQLTFGAIFPMMNLHSHQTRVIVIATASTSSNIGACHKCCKEKSLEITKKCLITKKSNQSMSFYLLKAEKTMLSKRVNLKTFNIYEIKRSLFNF